MVSPLKTKSVSRKVSVLPSIAFELYVYSTINSSLSLSTSPSVKGLHLSSSAFYGQSAKEYFPATCICRQQASRHQSEYATFFFLICTRYFAIGTKRSYSAFGNAPFFRSLFYCHKHKSHLRVKNKAVQ